MSWATSTRRQRLPKDWPKRRAQAKRRAKGACEAYWTPGRGERTEQHHPDCDGIGTDCDHIVEGDDHRLANLQWLSGPCHAAKTQTEAAKHRQGKREALRLPREPHPGAWPAGPPPRP